MPLGPGSHDVESDSGMVVCFPKKDAFVYFPHPQKMQCRAVVFPEDQLQGLDRLSVIEPMCGTRLWHFSCERQELFEQRAILSQFRENEFYLQQGVLRE